MKGLICMKILFSYNLVPIQLTSYSSCLINLITFKVRLKAQSHRQSRVSLVENKFNMMIWLQMEKPS